MNQTNVTFALGRDGLQASTLCLHSGFGLYYVDGEAPLADGGYGSVFKCFQPTTSGSLMPCVVKMIPLSVGGTVAVEEEYKRLCACSHVPGTVKVLQQPIYSATHGFVMTEYIQGDSLAEYLLRAASIDSTLMSMSMQWKAELLQELCLTVSRMHTAGIIHRDIKPGNIILSKGRGYLHLIDFGLAEETVTGVVKGYKGTLQYMAPEEVLLRHSALLDAQLSGSLPDDTYELDGQACDNFALGLVAYQFLTGRFPFPNLMASQEYHYQFLASDILVQLETLTAAYNNWMVADWENLADPRWARLWECTQDIAVFQMVRHLLAPTPQLRLKDLRLTPFMQQSIQLDCRASLSTVAPPLDLKDGISLEPVPGMPSILWDPYNPVFSTITGVVFRCFVTQQHHRAGGSGPCAHQVGPALIKVTDLFNWKYLQLPPHYGGSNCGRATSLAWHLNQEAAFLIRMCQQSAMAAPLMHLEQDWYYNVLRLPRSSMNMWPETLHTIMKHKVVPGTSVHPRGIQILAVRMLKALRQAHQCNVAFGFLTPAMVFLAPEAYLVDTCLGFLPPWGWSEQFGGSALSGAEYVANAAYMAPETIRAIQGCPIPNEPPVSTAADIFSLGALLKTVLLGCGQALVLSTLQQEAWAFVDSLMAQPISHRPSAERALCHTFLAAASLESCEKEMRLLLPDFSQDRDLLPIVPADTSCLKQAISAPEAASVGNSWAITAIYATLPMQCDSSSPGGHTAAAPNQPADPPSHISKGAGSPDLNDAPTNMSNQPASSVVSGSSSIGLPTADRMTAGRGRVPLSRLHEPFCRQYQDSQPDQPASPSPSSAPSLLASSASAASDLLNSFAWLQPAAATVDSGSIDTHHMAVGHTQQTVLDDSHAVSAGSQTQLMSILCSGPTALPIEQEHPATNLSPAVNNFRKVPQQSRLSSWLPPAAPAACSSSATASSSPSTEPSFVRAAEQQEEVQHSTQALPVQQGLPAPLGIIIDLSDHDPLREGADTDPAGSYSDVHTHGSIASQHSLAPSAMTEEQCPDSMQLPLFGSSPAQSAGPSVPNGTFVSLPQSHASSLESAMASQLCAQPEAYSCSQSQLGDQQWSALFLRAYLQTQVDNMQPEDTAALLLAPVEGASSIQQQPAEPSECPLELPAGTMQHHASHDCADGHESLWGDSWLAAFMEAHLQGTPSSTQDTGLDEASEGSATCSGETDPEAQSVASSDDQSANYFDEESGGDYDEEGEDQEKMFCDEESDVDYDKDDSVADPDDEATSVHGQLCCILKGRVQRLASAAVGWGYHAAGAAHGSLLGLKEGLRKSSG